MIDGMMIGRLSGRFRSALQVRMAGLLPASYTGANIGSGEFGIYNGGLKLENCSVV